jgi:site-specific DNA-methyltransferase (adenine-specific)
MCLKETMLEINQIHLGDCLELMHEIPDGSVDMVILDPPYYKIVAEDWDRYTTLDKWVDFIKRVAIQAKRILKPNGSLFLFGDDKNIAYLQVEIDKMLTLLNSIVWYKTNNQSIKAAANLRSYAPMTERILFYTPQLCPTGLETVMLDINNFQPLRQYFREYQEAIGLNLKQINARLGHRKAEHAFYWNSTQWDLPTEETYNQLGQTFHTNGFERREYEALRREYEALRRVFNASSDTLDVISGPIIKQSDNTDHPTTKPLWLIKKLILDTTREGFVVLDPMAGSGTTAIAAIDIGRNWLLIEKDPEYYQVAKDRIKERLKQPFLPGLGGTAHNKQLYPNCYPTAPKQLSLIDGSEAD